MDVATAGAGLVAWTTLNVEPAVESEPELAPPRAADAPVMWTPWTATSTAAAANARPMTIGIALPRGRGERCGRDERTPPESRSASGSTSEGSDSLMMALSSLGEVCAASTIPAGDSNVAENTLRVMKPATDTAPQSSITTQHGLHVRRADSQQAIRRHRRLSPAVGTRTVVTDPPPCQRPTTARTSPPSSGSRRPCGPRRLPDSRRGPSPFQESSAGRVGGHPVGDGSAARA